MQSSRTTPPGFYRSVSLRRSLLCILLAAISLFFAIYHITNNAEIKAKDAFENSRRELLLSRLGRVRVEHYRSGNGYITSDSFQKEINQLMAHGQYAYLILLDKDGHTVAQAGASFQPWEMELLARGAVAAPVLPVHELVDLADGVYINSVLELPHTSGLRAAYGISKIYYDSVGANLDKYLINTLWCSLLVLLLILLFITMYFIRPLRRALSPGPAGSAALVGRKDEIGQLCRVIRDLREDKSELESRPLITGKGALSAMSAILEDLEPAVLLICQGEAQESSVLASNAAARKLLGSESIPPSAHVLPLFENLLNQDQRREFRKRLEQLPVVANEPMRISSPDGERGYSLHLFMHDFLGQSCVVCVIYDISGELRMLRAEDETAAKVEEAIGARTEELVKVNEQLRQENAERRAIEQALVRAESRYREIVNNSIEGIVQRSADGRMLSANASMARILGYGSVEELLDAHQKPGSRISYTSEMEFAITELLDIRGWVSNLEFQAMMQDGSPVWVAMNARRVADSSGETLYYEAFIEDITSRKKTEEKLVYQAFHDQLTGLPNRSLFLDRLRMALLRSKRHKEYLFAVLYLDLDRFKNINDSFGHSAGDKMLSHASEKLLQCVRDADTVARFGGDEFAVLLADLEKPSQAVTVAKRICDALSETVSFHGQDVQIGASIGIVLSGLEYATPEEILRDADTAMYRTKMQGRKGYTVFNERMREETIAALAMENDLRGAAERGEIEAFYQPLLDLESGKILGFEALMRWRRAGEMISPVVFIPIAEESGLIYDLGLEMLRIVSRQVTEWTLITGNCDFIVHVNISSKQLMATHFWRDVQTVLLETGVNPRQLIFEITESVFLDYGTQVISIMNTVRDFGIRFCLDDFGTGFSSLSYLRLLPLESLKMDRSFIVDINTDNYSEAILRNLISMGGDLGLKVITEGVDQPVQVEVLRMVGCHYAQGFHFAEPLPAPAALEYMQLHGVAVDT